MTTIFAHSSGQPPAAIAVIRISGPQAHAAGAALAGKLPGARVASLRALRSITGELLDEALVLRFDGPASATGEDLVELHCHGGRAVVAAVLAALGALPGLREAQPGEFTRRALEHGRVDLTEAEGLADLLEAETEQQRRAALATAGGALRRQVEAWRERVLALSARAEAAIDYVGDEDETAIDLPGLRNECAALGAEWRTWLERPRVEALRRGLRVVLAGPPNAGKSSLLNALVGEDRAIVAAQAGTTRDVIEVPLALGGVPLVLIDTAGLRDAEDVIERMGVDLALKQTAIADILLWLGPPASRPDHPATILLHPQADRNGPAPAGSLAISSVTGEGIPALLDAILATARNILPTHQDVPLNQRQADHIAEAAAAVSGLPDDLLLIAEGLRRARVQIDHITGRAGVEDMLDGLFGRFCLGK